MEKTQTVSVLALIIAILALILAWVAYNRASDVSLIEEMRQESAEAVNDLQLRAARFEASARLQALQANEELQQDAEAVEAELADIRGDLSDAYQNVEGEARQEFNEIDAEFDQLESGVRSGTANALGALERLIGSLRQDVRTDENE